MTIIEFLEARIAEDEKQAAKHQESASRHGWGDYTARVMAECAAKRAIVDWWCNGVIGYVEVNGDLTNPLLPLAAVYADHPDYQLEWAA
jgi:hypothetical protein